MKTLAKLAWSVLAVGLTLNVAMDPKAQADEVQPVSVTNFPAVTNVQGSVAISGIPSHGQLVKRENIVVTTSKRNEITQLIPAGTVDTEGFTHVSVSLQGEVKASAPAEGAVGVLLVPDEEPIIRALQNGRKVEFPIEATVKLQPSDGIYFASEQVNKDVGFAHYKVYLYNTMTTAVEANVYLYLRN